MWIMLLLGSTREAIEVPLVVEDCLPPGLHEGLYTRKQALKPNNSAAIYDPSGLSTIEQM